MAKLEPLKCDGVLVTLGTRTSNCIFLLSSFTSSILLQLSWTQTLGVKQNQGRQRTEGGSGLLSSLRCGSQNWKSSCAGAARTPDNGWKHWCTAQNICPQTLLIPGMWNRVGSSKYLGQWSTGCGRGAVGASTDLGADPGCSNPHPPPLAAMQCWFFHPNLLNCLESAIW